MDEGKKTKLGYMEIGLRDSEGKKKYRRINRIVAETCIPNPKNKPHVDHKSGNTLDNRICNLRWATISENNHNKKTAKGYSFKKNRWEAGICYNGKSIYLGRFKTEEEARNAYLEASAKYFPNIKNSLSLN